MRSKFIFTILTILVFVLATSVSFADSLDFSTATGTVEKFEKDTLTVLLGEKSKKTIEFKVTGTTKLHLLAPQVRGGKTVATQRSAETTDLVNGQPIAVIYTVIEKENVLLTAVVKSLEKK